MAATGWTGSGVRLQCHWNRSQRTDSESQGSQAPDDVRSQYGQVWARDGQSWADRWGVEDGRCVLDLYERSIFRSGGRMGQL